MKIVFVALVASSCLLIQASGLALPSEHLPRKPRDVGRQYSWRIQNQDQDHITYVRTPAAGSESSSTVTGSSSSSSTSTKSSGSGSSSGLFATRSASLATRSGPSSGSQLTILVPESDCNKTTTPEPPTVVRGSRKPWQAAGLSSVDSAYSNSENVVDRRAQPELRSRSTITSGAGRQVSGASTGNTATRSQSQTTGAHPHEGNYFWMVSHRTDDHITYTRRSNGTETQSGDGGLQQGQLRQLGTGANTVSARVVDTKNDADISTEEGLLTRGSGSSRKTTNQKTHGSHLTHDLVHPYATRNATSSSSSSSTRSSSRTTVTTRAGAESRQQQRSSIYSQSQSEGSLKSNPATGRVNIIFQKQQQGATAGDLTKSGDESDNSYPNVGDEVDGWRVVSKNKEHISWERVVPTLPAAGAPLASAAHLVRSLDSNRHLQGSTNSISEHSSSSRSSSRQWKSGRGGGRSGTGRLGGQRSHSQSSTNTEVSEGFPVVFETYSKATFENDGVNQVGTIRTTLSNTTNWNVGDELSGWKVISKDGQSITWFKVNSEDDDSQSGGRQLKSGGTLGSDDSDENDLNEEDLLAGAGRGGAGNTGGADGDSDAYKGPPGTWYLAKESKNSITWQRDNVPDDIVFDMNEYPRIGDTQSQWQVSSKSRNHISWKRIGTTSDEDVAA